MIVIVMGVAGVGKTTVGRQLAQRLGWRFEDADDYHPRASIDKMRRGIALQEADRAAWLQRLAALLRQWLDQNLPTVLACSALKQSHRAQLQVDPRRVRFVFLKGDYALLHRRLQRRRGHYMKADLLASQFEALEEPGDVLTLDAASPPAAIVERIVQALHLGGRDAPPDRPSSS